jgi:hypothetical protein
VRCVNEEPTTVNFVWPDYVSLYEQVIIECGVHPDGGEVYSVRSLDSASARGISIFEVIGGDSSAVETFRRAVKRGHQAYLAHHDSTDHACVEVHDDDKNWQIVRSRRRWVMVGRADTHRLCGFGFEFPLDLDVPETIVGDRAEPSWQNLERRVQNLEDAYSSPARDILLAVTKDSLFLLYAKATDPGPLLQVPVKRGERVVMVEWATGIAVQRWTRELKAIRGQRFPPPTLLSPSR